MLALRTGPLVAMLFWMGSLRASSRSAVPVRGERSATRGRDEHALSTWEAASFAMGLAGFMDFVLLRACHERRGRAKSESGSDVSTNESPKAFRFVVFAFKCHRHRVQAGDNTVTGTVTRLLPPLHIIIAMPDSVADSARLQANERVPLDDLEASTTPSGRNHSAWPQPTRRRRMVVVAAGVAIHGALLIALVGARLDVLAPAQDPIMWTSLLPISPRQTPPTQPPVRKTLTRALLIPASRIPRPPSPPTSALIATVPASAASAPSPAGSSSERLRLTLTPSELRTLDAEMPRTLAQRLAPPPAAPLLAQRLAPTPQFEEDDRNGIHTVRSHGGCYILVPSGQAKADPFNHGGERLTGRSTNDSC